MQTKLLSLALAALAMLSQQPPAAPTIAGPEWVLVSLTGHEKAAIAGLERKVSAVFRDGKVAGSLGCNGFGGTYSIEGDRLVFGALVGTMMACPEPAMSIENAVRKALTGSVPFTLSDGLLTIQGSADTTLVFEEQPAAGLDGVWQVTALNNGREGVAAPRTGTPLTLRFRNGAVGGSTGCNTFRSGYVVEGDRLRIQGALVTRKACPAEVMEQERQFLAALETTARWTIREGRLELRRDDGALAVAATRER
jgi:heat shock protein HslJ